MALYADTRNLIFVRSNLTNAEPHIPEALANGVILPGDIVTLDPSAAKPLSRTATDDAQKPLRIADIDPFNDYADFVAGNRQTEIVYADGETVYYRNPVAGDQVQVRATAAVSAGDILTTAGATTPGRVAPDATPTAGTIQLVALEAQATVGDLFLAEVM